MTDDRRLGRGRAALLDAASKAFAERGYSGTRVEDITEAAGYSVGSFYTHFTGKQDVFHAVLGRLDATLPRPRQREGRTPYGDATQRLRTIEQVNTRYWRDLRAHAGLWAALEDASLSDEGARNALLRRARELRDHQLRSFEPLQRSGTIDACVDLESTLSALTAMTDWLAALRHVYDDRGAIRLRAADLTGMWALTLGLPWSIDEAISARTAQTSPTAPPVPPATHPELGAKAIRTRGRIVEAARGVIAASGLDARVRDIAAAAGVSVGTFYAYFETKELVLEALLDSLVSALEPGTTAHGPRQRILAANTAYIRELRTNGGLWRAIARAALADPTVRAALARQRDRHVTATARALQQWHETGSVRCRLPDPVMARALVALVERQAHLWFLLDDDPPDADHGAELLTRLWWRALDPADGSGTPG